jgi:hypothetical protein
MLDGALNPVLPKLDYNLNTQASLALQTHTHISLDSDTAHSCSRDLELKF